MMAHRIWKAIAKRILIYPAIIYGAVVLILFLVQSQIVFQPNIPTREIVATPASVGLDYETITITTEDGPALHGWFIPAQKERATLLFFHGNAGNISHRLDSIQIFNELGFSTLIIDYRGFGQSEGEPSEEGTYRDARASWRYLTEHRQVPPNKIVLFGRSLGGAIAAHLGAGHNPGGLVLESAFTSLPEIASDIYWFFPARWLTRMEYNTKAALRSISSPVLIIHSPEDGLVPYSHGKELFEAASNPKQFLKLRGGHNGGFLKNRKLYLQGLDRFLTEYLET
jgi:fermentation-respiration switch protein FrsA (DUF1100 family)